MSAYPCYISVYGKNVLDSEIMAKIAKNLTELIGHTPLMELAEYSRKYGLKRNIVAKLESFNPAGSVKDRVAFAMIEDAEARGALKPGATIIEPTSGNTGVGLAMVATIKGYHLILTMPETMSVERRNLLKALGAEIVLTDGLAGPVSVSLCRCCSSCCFCACHPAGMLWNRLLPERCCRILWHCLHRMNTKLCWTKPPIMPMKLITAMWTENTNWLYNT